MIKKLKVAVFPYESEFIPVLKNRHMLLDIEITYLISPHGFGLTNKDGYIHEDNKSGFVIQDGLSKEVIENIDAVWLTEAICKMNEKDFTYILEEICHCNKKIISTLNNYKDIIEKVCKKNNVELISAENYSEKYNLLNSKIITKKLELKKVNTPVITVLGISKFNQKFDLQLYLRNNFIKNGYKVSQIGTKSFCEALGFHSLPNYLIEDNFTPTDIILNFNNFVKEIEKKENPDVIIIGIPDGIFPLNTKHHFNFGIHAFEICNAVESDFTILSLFDGSYNDKFYKELETMCRYKFNTDIDAFFVSNYGIVSNSLDEINLSYTYAKNTFNESKKYKVFNSNALNDKNIFNYVIQKLSLYSSFKAI